MVATVVVVVVAALENRCVPCRACGSVGVGDWLTGGGGAAGAGGETLCVIPLAPAPTTP